MGNEALFMGCGSADDGRYDRPRSLAQSFCVRMRSSLAHILCSLTDDRGRGEMINPISLAFDASEKEAIVRQFEPLGWHRAGPKNVLASAKKG